MSDASDGTTSFGGAAGGGDPADLDAAAERVFADLEAAADSVEGLEQTSEAELVALVDAIQRLESERDELRDLAQRTQADFANYKRQVEARSAELRATAAVDLVRELLPVLDAGEAALAQGLVEVEPLHAQLSTTLEKLGLVRVADADVPFDPNVHEAVVHEVGDGEPEVAEVLRSGYLWNERVLRPAMVRVRG